VLDLDILSDCPSHISAVKMTENTGQAGAINKVSASMIEAGAIRLEELDGFLPTYVAREVYLATENARKWDAHPEPLFLEKA